MCLYKQRWPSSYHCILQAPGRHWSKGMFVPSTQVRVQGRQRVSSVILLVGLHGLRWRIGSSSEDHHLSTPCSTQERSPAPPGKSTLAILCCCLWFALCCCLPEALPLAVKAFYDAFTTPACPQYACITGTMELRIGP